MGDLLRVTAANVGLAVRKLKDGQHTNRDMTNLTSDSSSSADGMVSFAFATGVRHALTVVGWHGVGWGWLC